MAYTVLVRLEWDEAKSLANQEKHGVSFEEAAHLFTDEVDCLEIFDVLHSDEEDRFISIGPVERGLILVVWTERAMTSYGSSRQGGPRSPKRNVTEPIWDETHD